MVQILILRFLTLCEAAVSPTGMLECCVEGSSVTSKRTRFCFGKKPSGESQLSSARRFPKVSLGVSESSDTVNI